MKRHFKGAPVFLQVSDEYYVGERNLFDELIHHDTPEYYG